MKKQMKFKDIPCGSLFKDHRGTRFIKVKNHSGVIVNGKYEIWKLLKPNGNPYNAVSLDGCLANCPDWLEFTVTKLGKCFCKSAEHDYISKGDNNV